MKIHEDRSHMNMIPDGLKKAMPKKMSTPLRLQISMPTEAGAWPTNSFMTATPAKNGSSISVRQVWKLTQH